MQVTKRTWRMREQCVPGSLSSSHAQEPRNEASIVDVHVQEPKSGAVSIQEPKQTGEPAVSLVPGHFRASPENSVAEY